MSAAAKYRGKTKLARENSGAGDSLGFGWSIANPLYDNRKQVAAGLLILYAAFNLLDLFTTALALANGFVEANLPSLMIMGATGSLGYALAKLGYSLLLLWNARFLWRRLDRMSMRASLVILVLCFVMLVAGTSTVVNNVAVLWLFHG